MPASPFHVIIIGAGTGGLCLAQGLRRAGISVAVYERDRTRRDGLQGYRVGIDADGKRALRANLSPELYQTFVATCAQRPLYANQITGLDHPEFAVVGLEAQDACALLNALGESVRAGRRVEPGETVAVFGRRCRIGEVDPYHYEAGTFVEWDDYYRARTALSGGQEARSDPRGGRRARLAHPSDLHDS